MLISLRYGLISLQYTAILTVAISADWVEIDMERLAAGRDWIVGGIILFLCYCAVGNRIYRILGFTGFFIILLKKLKKLAL